MYALLAQAVEAAAVDVDAEFLKSITAWAQTGVVSVVSGLLIFVIVKLLPKKDTDHAAALEKKDTTFIAALKEVRDWHSKECEQVRADNKDTRETLEQCVNEFNRTTVMLWEKVAGKHP